MVNLSLAVVADLTINEKYDLSVGLKLYVQNSYILHSTEPVYSDYPVTIYDLFGKVYKDFTLNNCKLGLGLGHFVSNTGYR